MKKQYTRPELTMSMFDGEVHTADTVVVSIASVPNSEAEAALWEKLEPKNVAAAYVLDFKW